MTIYNLEKFAINDLFRPYLSDLISTADFPKCEDDPAKFTSLFEKRTKEIEREIRRDPMTIIRALKNNKSAYIKIFSRLNDIDHVNHITFYKWLKSPFIDAVRDGLCDARIKEQEAK